MKKFLSAILCSLMLCFAVFASSCMLGSGDALAVAGITTDLQDDGSTKVTITYTDEDIDPTVFYIPAGDKGERGNGIEDITYAPNADNTATVVTITYTDDDREPAVLTLPYGTFITDVIPEEDEEGNIKFTFKFSNGQPDREFTVINGKDGKDGTTITGSLVNENEDGSRTIVFYYSDGSEYSVDIPAPQKGEQGEQGTSISDISADATDDSYIVTVTYSDGTSSQFSLPKHSVWRTGEGAPSDRLGNIGDYYFDETNKIIYLKSGSWRVIADFSMYSDVEHVINFVIDKDTGNTVSVKMKHGSCFAASTGASIPLPQKPGYVFLGWYTKPEADPTSGKFTDLTAVLCDLTLYANWAVAE